MAELASFKQQAADLAAELGEAQRQRGEEAERSREKLKEVEGEPEEAPIQYRQFVDENDLPSIMGLVDEQLSEPYSIFTYRYFISQWPQLCLMAFAPYHSPPSSSSCGSVGWEKGSPDIGLNSSTTDESCEEAGASGSKVLDVEGQGGVKVGGGGRCVGTIVCKMDAERERPRGYIAMLVVVKEFRGRGIATELVSRCIEAMKGMGCEEVTLEAEVTNEGALALYGNLGFLRAKRLHRYYLNGVDAFRLKLLLPREAVGEAGGEGEDKNVEHVGGLRNGMPNFHFHHGSHGGHGGHGGHGHENHHHHGGKCCHSHH